jgi:predicted GIY-YIG superfamily endonuclease
MAFPLKTLLPCLELDAEANRAELGYAVSIALEIEHACPAVIWPRADLAARIARTRRAAEARQARSCPVGTVYVLHFDQPYRHARHYTGWTADLETRLAAHASGRGARLVEVVTAAGISWQLAATWPGVTRAFERTLKNRHGASQFCPLCPRRLPRGSHA